MNYFLPQESLFKKAKSQLVFLILFLNLLSGCHSGSNLESTSIVVSGKIEEPLSDKLYFYTYPDTKSIYLETKKAVDTVLLDKYGNFSFEIPTREPLTFNIEDGKYQLAVNLFACPGDEIQIIFKGNERNPEINNNTPAGKFNNFLVRFLYNFYREPATKKEYYIGTNYMNGHNFLIYNNQRENDQKTFMNTFFRGDSLRKEYSDYALNTIQYGIGVDRLMYVWKKRMKSEPVVLDSTYFDFITPSFLENKDGYSCPAYVRFLNLYIKDVFERKVENGEYPVIANKTINPVMEKYKLAVNMINKPYCDAVLYSIIQKEMYNLKTIDSTIFSPDLSIDSTISMFNRKYILE